MSAAASRRIAIVGMGRTGRSVAAFARRMGWQCEGFDEQPVAADPGIVVHVGRLDPERLARFDEVIVSPGINWNHPALVELRRRGVPVRGDLDLFAAHYRGRLLGVTGTNGKTTTVTLIAMLLDVLEGGIEAGGNIGRPMLDLLAEEPRRVVLELSSFQLERAEPIRFHWAALVGFAPDHADMHESIEHYREAKLRLFARQAGGDTAVLPLDPSWDALSRELAARGVRVLRHGATAEPSGADLGVAGEGKDAQLFWTQEGRREFVPVSEIPVRAPHLLVNLAIAAQAGADHGVSQAVIREAVTSFRGLPHRLQWVAHAAGRDWYNDSKATNPDAAAAALGSFDQVIWICGGRTKGLALDDLAYVAAKHAARMLIIGRDPGPFEELARKARVPHTVAGTLERAVSIAARLEPPLPVLLSPAAASQDQFRDYVERGETFRQAIRLLEKAA